MCFTIVGASSSPSCGRFRLPISHLDLDNLFSRIFMHLTQNFLSLVQPLITIFGNHKASSVE